MMNIILLASFAGTALLLLIFLIFRTKSSPDINTINKKLEEILWLFRLPNRRGIVGEYLLAQLLADWLPRSAFSLQYSFQNGRRVDAIVRLGKMIVPIDSKFPLEQVSPLLEQADKDGALPKQLHSVMQKFIDSIAERYIQPNEGTSNFALLYIPSESIFYRCFVMYDNSIFSYASNKQVIPVSPGTLFLYLQTIAAGLRDLAFSENRHKIMRAIQQLRLEIKKLATSLHTSTTHFRNLEKSWDQLAGTVRSIERAADRLDDGGT